MKSIKAPYAYESLSSASNPIFMYAYLFSYEDKNPKPIKNITIVTKLNANNRNLIKEFIIKKDFDFLAAV